MSVNSKLISVEKVKQFRQDNGWSQYLLAKASGLSLRTIQRIEKDGKASAETQLALAATFNISPKELFVVSSTLEAHWKWRNVMQSALAISIVIGMVVFLLRLAGDLTLFIDESSAVFILLFMYSATVVAFGSTGLIKSVQALKYLFTSDISVTPASLFLASILKKQIIFLYGGALVALLIGSIAIHSLAEESIEFHRAYAVNLIILLYAAIFAEAILRPLATKLSMTMPYNEKIQQEPVS
jgi:DNA-binding XRE family transcriptional regulator